MSLRWKQSVYKFVPEIKTDNKSYELFMNSSFVTGSRSQASGTNVFKLFQSRPVWH